MIGETPFIDHASPILQNAPITDEQRADLWDTFHQTKDPAELAQHLASYGAPEPVNTDLIAAKHRALGTHSTGDPTLDKGFTIIDRLGGIDQAEAHPKIATALIGLASKAEEKAAGEAVAKPAPSGKGKTAKNPQTQPETAPPPRPDGLPALPPIPDGHHRILASDGGIHDIPAENLETARKIDPYMHVLNP